MKITYPDVEVRLTGTDGNVFSVLGKVKSAISKKHGADAGEEFLDKAQGLGSYDEVLQFVMQTVEVS